MPESVWQGWTSERGHQGDMSAHSAWNSKKVAAEGSCWEEKHWEDKDNILTPQHPFYVEIQSKDKSIESFLKFQSLNKGRGILCKLNYVWKKSEIYATGPTLPERDDDCTPSHHHHININITGITLCKYIHVTMLQIIVQCLTCDSMLIFSPVQTKQQLNFVVAVVVVLRTGQIMNLHKYLSADNILCKWTVCKSYSKYSHFQFKLILSMCWQGLVVVHRVLN